MFEPRFEMTPYLVNLLVQAAELRGEIGRSVVDVPWLPVLQLDTAARLSHSSTAIEGNLLSLPDVEALARGETLPGPARQSREVLNHLAALRWIWKKDPAAPFREEDLLHLHRLLTAGLLRENAVGRYKDVQNRVVDGRGVTVYTPPPPAKAGPLTRDLLLWIDRDAANLPPIVTAAAAHHELASIHPFLDGNGRAARALETWILYTRGFDTHHLFALDEFFERDRPRYYEKINQARELDGVLTYWLEYVAEGLVETLKKTLDRIASLQTSSAKGGRILLTSRQEDVLRLLRNKGRAKSGDIEKALKISRARIAVILAPLLKAGLVARSGASRATTYHLK